MRKPMPIFYSAIILTGVNLLLRFVGTSFQVYISANMGPSGVGLLQLILSVGSLAITAGVAGIRTTTMYLTAEEAGRKNYGNIKWVLRSCTMYCLICSSCVGFILYSLAPQLAVHWIGNERTVIPLQLLAMILPFNCMCGMMTGYFTAVNRIGTLAAVEVAEQISSVICTLFLLQHWAADDQIRACVSVILGSAVGSLLTLVCLIVLRYQEHTKTGPKIHLRHRLIHTAVPLAVADDLKAGISTTENLMVPKRLKLYSNIADPLAAYGLITGMVFPVLMFPAAILFSLAELLIPELARCAAAGSRTRIRYLVKRSLKVAMLYGCFFAGLMYLLAEPLCLALYNNTNAGPLLKRFAILIPMLYCDAITDAMTKGLGQQKVCVRYNIATSLLDVLLLFLLLPNHGLEGYYFSFLISHILNFGLSIRRLFKISGYTPSIKTVAQLLFATGAAAMIAGYSSSSTLCAIGYIAILFCLLVFMQVLRKDDLLWLYGLVYNK